MIPIGEERRLPIFPFVVYGLIGLNVWAFAQEISAPDFDRYVNAFALIPYDVTHNIVLGAPSPPLAILTLFTALFIHGGFWHIAANMLFLFVFGPDVEFLCGHVRFLLFYMLAGIAGGIAQISIGPGSHIPEIGASGAIAGVLGAYIVNFPTARVNTIVPIGCFPLFLRLPALVVIGLWAVLQFVTGFGTLAVPGSADSGGTAYFAHIGGFCAGVLLIGFFRLRDQRGRRYRWYY
jgi:membrane associated rhomboid family serine protease